MKNTNLYKIIIFILCFIAPVQAQENNLIKKHHNIKLGVEIGTDFFFGDPRKPDMVRESKSSNYYYNDHDFYCGLILDFQNMNVSYFGIKPEIFFLKNRLGISSGLRFSRYSSYLKSDRDYFLWLIHQDDIYTEYVKINRITQNSYYLGIPLEVKFFPNRRELPAQFYMKVGSTFNYRLQTNNKIEFQNHFMESNADMIDDQINDSNLDFNAYMFFAAGIKIGRFKAGSRRKTPNFNIEIHPLNIMLTDKASSFIRTNAGIGFQVSAQIPIGKSAPIGSKYLLKN